jgi:hypothetical protein
MMMMMLLMIMMIMMIKMTTTYDIMPQLQVHDVISGELLGASAPATGRPRVRGKSSIEVYRSEGGAPRLACLSSSPPAVTVIDPVTVTELHRLPWEGEGAVLTQMCMFESLEGRTCLAVGDKLGDVHVVDLGEAPPVSVSVEGMPAANKKG